MQIAFLKSTTIGNDTFADLDITRWGPSLAPTLGRTEEAHMSKDDCNIMDSSNLLHHLVFCNFIFYFISVSSVYGSVEHPHLSYNLSCDTPNIGLG